MTIEIRSLEGRSVAELTQLFNYGFQEYVIPLQLNEAQMSDLVNQEDLRLDLSCEAIVDGKSVGFCSLAVRDDVAWCAGIGVGPAYRGLGVGKELLCHSIDLVRRLGLKKYTLECISENLRALGLYKSFGFRVVDGLYNFKHMQPTSLGIELKPYCWIPGCPVDVTRHWDEFHTVPKSWQADLPTLMHFIQQLQIQLLMDGDVVVGMAIYSETPTSVVIRDLGVKDENPRVCQVMLAQLHGLQKPIYQQFVPARSVVAKVLAEMGYERFIDQVQMELAL